MMNERNFTPRLGQGELPDISEYAVLLPKHFHSAAEMWDRVMPAYQNVLYATVIGDHEQLFDPVEIGDWRMLLRSQRYRNTQTREVIGSRKIVDLRDLLTDRMHPKVEELSLRLVERDITLHRWVIEMAQLGRNAHLAAYMFGSGGYNTITQSDVLDLEETLRNTHSHLLNLANDVLVGNTNRQEDPTVPRIVTARGLRNRGIMWIESITRSFERARATTYGIHPDILPNYPADGSMLCLVRCRCHWRFTYPVGVGGSYYHATWTLRFGRPDGRNCQTCLLYSEIYNPYTVIRF